MMLSRAYVCYSLHDGCLLDYQNYADITFIKGLATNICHSQDVHGILVDIAIDQLHDIDRSRVHYLRMLSYYIIDT